jgi:hypothetical protein
VLLDREGAWSGRAVGTRPWTDARARRLWDVLLAARAPLSAGGAGGRSALVHAESNMRPPAVAPLSTMKPYSPDGSGLEGEIR